MPANATQTTRATQIVSAAQTTTKGIWTGRILSGLPILFLLFDGIAKVMQLPPVIEGTVRLGYPPSILVPLGCTLLACDQESPPCAS